jgi:hypothetical protein
MFPCLRFWNSSSRFFTIYCGMNCAQKASTNRSQVQSWSIFLHFSYTRCHQSWAGTLSLKVANLTFCYLEYCKLWKMSSICSVHCFAFWSYSTSPKNVGGWNFRNLSNTTSSPCGTLQFVKVCKISAIFLKAYPTVASMGLSGAISSSGVKFQYTS